MKLHFPAEQGVREAASKLAGLSRRRVSLERARSQLSHVVGDALNTSLELLGERLGVTRLAGNSVSTGRRLRDVVERDRALSAVVSGGPKKAVERSTELPPSERAQASVPDEPIRTRTMARLLASQGYRARALAIYDELISRNPDDLGLREEAAPLRA